VDKPQSQISCTLILATQISKKKDLKEIKINLHVHVQVSWSFVVHVHVFCKEYFTYKKQDCLFIQYAHMFMAPLILHIHLFLTICLQLLYTKYSKYLISNIGYMKHNYYWCFHCPTITLRSGRFTYYYIEHVTITNM